MKQVISAIGDFFGCSGVSSAYLAIGLPAFAMIISSSAAAFSINRDKRVLASWMLMIGILVFRMM